MTQPQVCPDHLWSITWSCWNEDPMRRPTFESLQNQLEDFVTGQQNQYHSAESQFGWWRHHYVIFIITLYGAKHQKLEILPVTWQNVTVSIVPLLSKFIPAHLLPTLFSLLLDDVIIYYVIELFVQINRIAFTFDTCEIDYKDVIRSIHLKPSTS